MYIIFWSVYSPNNQLNLKSPSKNQSDTTGLKNLHISSLILFWAFVLTAATAHTINKTLVYDDYLDFLNFEFFYVQNNKF